jgi:hypothetical protein
MAMFMAEMELPFGYLIPEKHQPPFQLEWGLLD